MPHEEGVLNWETPQGVDFDRLTSELEELKKILETSDSVPDVIQVEATRGCRYWPNGIENWDLRQLLSAVLVGGETLSSAPVILFVEGFLLFANEKVAKMCNERIWLEVDKDTALNRRFQREKLKWRADLEEFSGWFADTVWEHYLKYRPLQIQNASPITIEVLGARGLEDIVEEVSSDLQQILTANYGYAGKAYEGMTVDFFFSFTRQNYRS